MGQTAMFTHDHACKGVSVGGHEYPVRDQVAVVDDDFIENMRSLGFITAAEANIKAAEVSTQGAPAAAPVAKAEATSPAPAKAEAPVAAAKETKGKQAPVLA